jgi:hypothetical protein
MTGHAMEGSMRHVVIGCVTCLAVAVPAAAHHGPGTFDLRSSVSYPVATLTGSMG